MYKRDRSRSASPDRLPHAHLYVQAHEATLVNNQDNIAASVEYSAASTSASVKGKGKKTALVRWETEDNTTWLDEEGPSSGGPSQDDIWVDRSVPPRYSPR